MSNRYKTFYFVYLLWLIVFILFTNRYYDPEEIILIGQLDSFSYMAIANSAPNYSTEIIPYHHAQRVFFPYFIGIVAKIFNVDVYHSFQLFTFLSLLLVIFLHYLIIENLKTDFLFSIISISLLILNPYIFRYAIAVPTMINDIVFILSLYLFIFSLRLNNNYFLFSIFLGLISRQNGIFLFFANLINLFFKNKLKFYKNISFILSILILFVIFFISNRYSSKVSIQNFNYGVIYGIFDWLINSWNFLEFIQWILLPFYSYLPIIILIFFYRKLKDFQKKDFKNYSILVFLFLSIVGMPVLSGPELSGRNIIRLTTLAYPIFLIWASWFTTMKRTTNNKSLLMIIILILHVWSLHPTYSDISLFANFRNYIF